jgi:hypothetical protein
MQGIENVDKGAGLALVSFENFVELVLPLLVAPDPVEMIEPSSELGIPPNVTFVKVFFKPDVLPKPWLKLWQGGINLSNREADFHWFPVVKCNVVTGYR